MSSNVVYTGVWDDYERGPVLSRVLTMEYRTGTYLITLLAILVTFAANRSWKIWRLVLHTALRYQAEHEYLIRQKRSVLTNAETTGGALLAYYEIAMLRGSWKGLPVRIKLIAACLILFALVHWVGFIALGILTTQVNLGSIVRSLKTDSCGFWFARDDLDEKVWYNDPAGMLTVNASLAAENYVQNCYVKGSTSISDCKIFLSRSINHTTQSVPCPFQDSSMCITPNGDALSMESKDISLSGLGINWKYAKDISFRRRSVCAPIAAERFIYSNESSQALLEDTLEIEDESIGLRAYSFQSFVATGDNYTRMYRTDDAGDFDLTIAYVWKESDYQLHEPLRPTDQVSETTIVSLRGRAVSFSEPSDDPFFYAHENFSTPIDIDVDGLYYMNNDFKLSRQLNAIACQDTAKACSKITGLCTDWIAPGDMINDDIQKQMLGNNMDDRSLMAYHTVAWPLAISTTLNQVVQNRGASIFRATQNLGYGRLYSISSEQWKIEVEHWFLVGMGLLQMAPHRMVSTPELDTSKVQNAYPELGDACTMVKFRSPGHVTVSMFGMMFIIVGAFVLTIVSYLDILMGWILPTRVSTLLVPWERDSYLQLLDRVEQHHGTASSRNIETAGHAAPDHIAADSEKGQTYVSNRETPGL
ncbi:hypothetical protein P153DRAFT_433721 [Dothidotthia symphoricarpi CBS 119687]|uniref:Uncharacterized protein n=1 Tax=Dothidotthia symphoricarpi CBS 119687 TaxID=1392245 RepID=A0A6A6A7I2_9PLEO|nr:uncharacterized protein P153DRAFT_433721 [Dothidotthia symphoricarpi CBS 119687]KAF2126601.1 hypothetical protein P153DRAFT_433721 [Dothidotthia symphoricarpi CBS 119687]